MSCPPQLLQSAPLKAAPLRRHLQSVLSALAARLLCFALHALLPGQQLLLCPPVLWAQAGGRQGGSRHQCSVGSSRQ